MPRLLVAAARLIDGLCAVLLSMCLVAVVAQVVMRYGFNNATTWSDPVASDSLAWLTLLGAAGAVGRDENLSVRFLWTRLGTSSRRIAKTFCQIVILLFAASFVYSGILLMGDTADTHVEGLRIDVSWAMLYSATVIAGGLMALFAVARIIILWAEP